MFVGGKEVGEGFEVVALAGDKGEERRRRRRGATGGVVALVLALWYVIRRLRRWLDRGWVFSSVVWNRR